MAPCRGSHPSGAVNQAWMRSPSAESKVTSRTRRCSGGSRHGRANVAPGNSNRSSSAQQEEGADVEVAREDDEPGETPAQRAPPERHAGQQKDRQHLSNSRGRQRVGRHPSLLAEVQGSDSTPEGKGRGSQINFRSGRSPGRRRSRKRKRRTTMHPSLTLPALVRPSLTLPAPRRELEGRARVAVGPGIRYHDLDFVIRLTRRRSACDTFCRRWSTTSPASWPTSRGCSPRAASTSTASPSARPRTPTCRA